AWRGGGGVRPRVDRARPLARCTGPVPLERLRDQLRWPPHHQPRRRRPGPRDARSARRRRSRRRRDRLPQRPRHGNDERRRCRSGFDRNGLRHKRRAGELDQGDPRPPPRRRRRGRAARRGARARERAAAADGEHHRARSGVRDRSRDGRGASGARPRARDVELVRVRRHQRRAGRVAGRPDGSAWSGPVKVASPPRRAKRHVLSSLDALAPDSRRRLLLASCAALLPGVTSAQPASRPRLIGVLGVARPNEGGSDPMRVFVAALAELGWVDGKTLVITWRGSEPRYDSFPEHARELVGLGVDLIVVNAGITAALAAKQATATIPILAIGVADPVKFGLVASMARPGGNVTGFAATTTDWGKYLELAREA